MPHWERQPDPRLAPFVLRLCFSTDPPDATPAATYRVLPDGATDLLFRVEAGELSCGERPCDGTAFGIKTRPLLVSDSRRLENIAVQLRPGAACGLLGVSASELTDQRVEVATLFGPAGRGLLQRLGAADTFGQRRRLIERFLLRHLIIRSSEERGAEDVVRTAVGWIQHHRGAIRVAELARWTGLHERGLERLFRRHVGVSPKRFARIVRFNAAHHLLRRGRPPLTVAATLGYSDQAHLCRDFRSLGGFSPRDVGFVQDSAEPGS